MEDLSKQKPVKQLSGVPGPRRRFFETAAAEGGKEGGKGLGDMGMGGQAGFNLEGIAAAVESREGGHRVPNAPRQGPRKRFFETAAAEGGKEEGRGLGDMGRGWDAGRAPEGTPAPVESTGGWHGVPNPPRRRHFEMPATSPPEAAAVKATPAPPKGGQNRVAFQAPAAPALTTGPEKTVRRRDFEMPGGPPPEGLLLPAEEPSHGLHVRPAVPHHPVDSTAIIGAQGEVLPGTNPPQPPLRRRHFESAVVPADPVIHQNPGGVDIPITPAEDIHSGIGMRAAPRRRHFILPEGPEMPTIPDCPEPRRLQDIEGSPDSGVEVPLSIFVDQVIDDSRPIDPKLRYYTPPPEAQRLMVRNIARRHNGATHPLEGYYSPKDPSNIHFDNTQYPDDFVPPLISYHTEDQLRNVHCKVEDADYNTTSYQEKLHFVKGARLTQLEWELNNINLLGELGKELQELKDELLPLVLD